MKKINKIIYYLFFGGLVIYLSGCHETITDYGFTGKISGSVFDPSGNIISGDVTTEDMVVMALGESEEEPMRIRVKGDGTFANSHMYPQVYTIWLSGAVESDEEYRVDLSGNAVTQEIVATPYISLPPPEILGSPSENSVTINYSMTENNGHVAEERLVYVSTVHYPGQSTGSGPYWNTIRETLADKQGNITVEGLEPDTNYYIRTAARAEGTNWWNLSDQIMFKTP